MFCWCQEVLSLINSQVMVRRKGRCLCFQPSLPPLCCCRSFWVLDINHIAQLLLSGRCTRVKSLLHLCDSQISTQQLCLIAFRKDVRISQREGIIIIFELTCNLANTPDLWLPKPYVCRALSSSSEVSLYTSCSTCQSKSPSSSSSSSPTLSLHSFQTLNQPE